MAEEAYGGLVGAFAYAMRRSHSWLFRTYVVASAALGAYVGLLLVLAVVTWLARPVAFGERAFLGVVGLLLLLPLFAPVLVVARRHRRGTPEPSADRWLGLAGYAFVVSLVLALFISDPAPHGVEGTFGPAAGWLDRLPDAAGLLPPVVAAAAIAVAVRVTRPPAE